MVANDSPLWFPNRRVGERPSRSLTPQRVRGVLVSGPGNIPSARYRSALAPRVTRRVVVPRRRSRGPPHRLHAPPPLRPVRGTEHARVARAVHPAAA